MQRLKDSDENWGKTRIENASILRRQMRDRERKRRDRARMANLRAVLIARRMAEPAEPGTIWKLRSDIGRELGITAITGQRVMRHKSWFYLPTDRQRTDSPISLPFVSIQHPGRSPSLSRTGGE